jgi:uncharacterized protein
MTKSKISLYFPKNSISYKHNSLFMKHFPKILIGILATIGVVCIVFLVVSKSYFKDQRVEEISSTEATKATEKSTPIAPPILPKLQADEKIKTTPEYLQIKRDGSNLQFEKVLAKEPSYTRYQISYQSEGFKISWVMNIPTGKGKYPLIILNHGYIDPAVYTLGRGLKREQDFLAQNGFAVLHTDYRNHAFSDDDKSMQWTGSIMRTKKYGADSINAILAVQNAVKNGTLEVQNIESEKVAMLGHSMGGWVTIYALTSAPELIDAAILYAPVHINEYYNFQKWGKTRLNNEQFKQLESSIGDTNIPENFIINSPLGYIENIAAPVQMYFWTLDESCPIVWGDDIEREFQKAGKDVNFIKYTWEYHEFWPRWKDFMNTSVEFLKKHLQ